MKKNISINLQGIIFHIEDDGYEVLSRYLHEVKAHFASYQGHEEIVADIEGRIAELFAARVSVSKQVITLADVEEMTAKMGRVSDFQATDDEDEAYTAPTAGPAPTPGRANTADADGQPRRLYRDLAHRKVAGVCAGLAQYFMVNPLLVRLIFLALVLLPNLLRHRFPFPGVGVFDRSFDLSGLAVISYVVLWIALPKRTDAPTPIDTLDLGGSLSGRKLFRDVDAGKVGGVAAGLAAYFRTDVVLVRVLFLLSAVLTAGTTLVAYIVLWAVVPEARTVSEKMQMRGDAVTLSGIDNNLRSSTFDDDSSAPAGSRSVGTFLEGAARQAQPAVSFFGTLIRWAVAALLIFVGGSALLTTLSVGAAALGIVSTDSVLHGGEDFRFGDESFNSVVHNAQPWGIVALMLATGIPALALILLGVRLALRRSVLGRSGSLVVLGVWLLGVFGTAAGAAQIARDYQTRASYTTTRRLAAVPGTGIVLASRDMDEFMGDEVSFRLALADSGAAPFLEEDYQARGRTQSAARLTAQQSILYNISQQDSTITFDQGITLREHMPFRNQRLTLTLHLPLDKVYRLTPSFIDKLEDSDFTNRNRPQDDQEHRARFTRQGKFTCLDCPAAAGADDEDADLDDSRDEGVVNLGANGMKMRVDVNPNGAKPSVRISTEAPKFNTNPSHYGTGRKTLDDPEDFHQIEAHGSIQVLVHQGDSYRVEAAGRPQDLDKLSLSLAGERLVLKQQGTGIFPSFGFSTHSVLVTVTLPRLQQLELHGACQADVSGFRDEDLNLEASGASFVRLDVNVPVLKIDLDGASHADLRGTATTLSIDGSSASQVDGLGLRAERTTLKLSGASQATVQAVTALNAHLSSASRARYAGQPSTIEKNLSGASSLEQVRP